MERICGIHAVYEAIVSRKRPIERIHISRDAQSGKIKEILDLARQMDVPVRRQDRSIIDRLSLGTVHQGIVAITAEAAYTSFESLFQTEKPIVVVLDGVEDPHNLGAVIRTAEAAGAAGIVVPERHSAPLSATVVKA